MSEHVFPPGVGGLIALGAADVLWADLTSDSVVPMAPAPFTCSSPGAGEEYVLLGGRVVTLVNMGGGRRGVAENEVRRAAADLNAVAMNARDLVRVGPFGGAPRQQPPGRALLRWRRTISWELHEATGSERGHGVGGGPGHLAGIDWRRVLVEQSRQGTERAWWLPRAVVRLLDAAEHAETRWLQTARTHQPGAAVTEQPANHRQPRADSRQPSADRPILPPRPYNGELSGHVYSALSRKPGIARKVGAWACAVCRTAPAAVLDHCHEHGYVRAPVCQSCNTQERPDHLYSNDIRVAGHYTRLFDTHTTDWLTHWHRCPGCRTRTTLPLPHLAAWTAHTACRQLRPTHPVSRGRKPCGVLRVSWTGDQNAPRSCLLTVSVDFCPSGEHRVLKRVPYRAAVERFRAWLVETAPAVAASAGPDRLDDLPTRFRPVIMDSNNEGQALF